MFQVKHFSSDSLYSLEDLINAWLSDEDGGAYCDDINVSLTTDHRAFYALLAYSYADEDEE